MNRKMIVQIEIEPEEQEDLFCRDGDARYGFDHFFAEPHCEPVTIKLTPSKKQQLIQYAIEQGYTNLSAALRDLILMGIEYQPARDKTLHDLIAE